MKTEQAWPGSMGTTTTSAQEAAEHAAMMAAMYRSEAFAEDVEDLLANSPLPAGGPLQTAVWSGWIFVLPAALAVIGSASALVWI